MTGVSLAQATIWDYLKLHFIVFIWSFTVVLGKLISVPAVELVFYRATFAGLIMGAFLLLFKRKSLLLPPKEIFKLLLTGLVVAGHWILFFAAAKVSNISICLVGLSTASFWTSIIEPFINKRAIKWYEILLGLCIVVGLYIIFQFGIKAEYILGLCMAILSALLAAVFSTLNSRFTNRYEPQTITTYEMLGAGSGIALFFPSYAAYLSERGSLDLALKNLPNFANQSWVSYLPFPTDVLFLAILIGVCTLYAYSASVELLRRIPVFMTNLTINLEPIYGIILAVLFFNEGEELNLQFFIGTAIILLSILAYPFIRHYEKKSEAVRIRKSV
jgi:drug/metabolite transporter (DMT)-like permease